ncbi:unnamed protein product [Linum tenue]|uniref:Uncharacterized protein n=1 Tax=Linum tenue TaxID=586396 RepID=A0AAV0R3I6_9ROSI|nr:unnamed protein product [Linum tenue]
MARFVVDSNSLFFYGTVDSTIVVLDTRSDLNRFPTTFHEWKTVAIVTCPLNNRSSSSSSAAAAAANPIGRKLYTELEIFGNVIEGANLRRLRAELFTSQLLVNREGYQVGYCNDDACKALALGSSLMLKINSMFEWWRYGVKPEVATAWKRYDVGEDDEDVVDVEKLAMELEEQSKELKECRARMAEKEEIVDHYKRLLEESREVLRQKSKVVEEKERVIEEQRRLIEKKDGEIEELEVRLWEMS